MLLFALRYFQAKPIFHELKDKILFSIRSKDLSSVHKRFMALVLSIVLQNIIIGIQDVLIHERNNRNFTILTTKFSFLYKNVIFFTKI